DFRLGEPVQTGRLRHDPHEGFGTVCVAEDLPQILRADRILKEDMAGREDSADRLHGVAGEGDLPAGFLLDLRRVAMARGRVDAHDPGPLRVLGGGTSIESPGRARNSGMRTMERPWGIARKSRSHESRSAWGVNTRSVTLRRFGWARLTGLPAIESEVTCPTSTFGCRRRSRRSSPPV